MNLLRLEIKYIYLINELCARSLDRPLLHLLATCALAHFLGDATVELQLSVNSAVLGRVVLRWYRIDV